MAGTADKTGEAAARAARDCMVDSQLRPNKVIDRRISGAMRSLPRERFLPRHLAAIAYIDDDIPLGGGRSLLAPLKIARLIQLARPQPNERALVIGAGGGYGAAVLAACVASVTALESDEALLAIARDAVPRDAPAVHVQAGSLVAGWPAGAPYDIILIEGAVETIPDAIAAQLRPRQGRIVTILARPGEVSRAVLAEPGPSGLSFISDFDCPAARLPGFLKPVGFAF